MPRDRGQALSSNRCAIRGEARPLRLGLAADLSPMPTVTELYQQTLAERGFTGRRRAAERRRGAAALRGRVGGVQVAPRQRDHQDAGAPADPARRVHVRRRGPRQELPDGLLLPGRAAQAQGAPALPRVHARGAPRAAGPQGHGRPAAGARPPHLAALPADLLRRVPHRRRHRRDDPAPAAAVAVRQPRLVRHHVQLQARRPLPERPEPRAHPARDRRCSTRGSR